MKFEIINNTNRRVPGAHIEKSISYITKKMKSKYKLELNKNQSVVLAFISVPAMKKMNKQFRNKNKVTDILSFDPIEPDSLGELVICYDQIKKQAKEHSLAIKFELDYMIIHGILHLLGFDHEKSAKEAQKMFDIQDDIFAQWLQKAKS